MIGRSLQKWDPTPGWIAVLVYDYLLTVVLWFLSPRYRRFQRDIGTQGHSGRHWTTYRRHQRRVAVQTKRLYPNGRAAGRPSARTPDE